MQLKILSPKICISALRQNCSLYLPPRAQNVFPDKHPLGYPVEKKENKLAYTARSVTTEGIKTFIFHFTIFSASPSWLDKIVVTVRSRDRFIYLRDPIIFSMSSFSRFSDYIVRVYLYVFTLYNHKSVVLGVVFQCYP